MQDEKSNTMALLFLMLKDKLNGYNLYVDEGSAFFDFIYDEFAFTLLLKGNKLKFSSCVEDMRNGESCNFKEVDELFETDFSILEVLAKMEA